jgi:hypothetical protein
VSTKSVAVKPPYSIDAVMMGRNDEYEPNWNEKLCASIAHNRRMFDGSRVDYRVTFVEWNPPRDRPLLSPVLVERFPFLRAIVVRPEVHDALCESDHGIMLNFSLNCGLRTSTADFCLISAGDLFIGRQLASYIKELGLSRNCLYRAERVNIRADIDFANATSEEIEDPANTVEINTCTEPPYDVPPYFHACGDFLLTDRLSMIGVRGFDESIRFARLHLDSRFCKTCVSAGLHANLIGRIFHISHINSYTNQRSNYRDRPYGHLRGLPYLNGRDWGLADHVWTRLGDRLWSVDRAEPGRSPGGIPDVLSTDEKALVNDITRRIIAAKEQHPPLEPVGKPVTFKSYSGSSFRVLKEWPEPKVHPGSPTVIETVSDAWGFSALLNLRHAFRRLPFLPAGEGRHFWFVEVDAEALDGAVGISLLKQGEISNEVMMAPGEGRRHIYVGAAGDEEELLVRNVSTEGRPSRVAIHRVRILRVPKTPIDASSVLL